MEYFIQWTDTLDKIQIYILCIELHVHLNKFVHPEQIHYNEV